MNPISVVSFVRNEEANIEPCFKLLREYVDEIIIIDLESTDNTYEVALKYADRVEKRPYALCGDQYKMLLAALAKNQWMLWTYPDERWVKPTLEMFSYLVKTDKYTAYSFMRHEYLDDVRVAYEKDGKTIQYGSVDCPNWQNRLHRLGKGIFYSELVHAELHGNHSSYGLPPEYFFEHRKSRNEQEIDNWRTYVWMKHLVWKYGDTPLEPFKTYIDSYKRIIHDSEELNKAGKRTPHMAEERWWEWQKYVNYKRGEGF